MSVASFSLRGLETTQMSINGRMDMGVLHSREWMNSCCWWQPGGNLRILMLSKRQQRWKRMILFIQNSIYTEWFYLYKAQSRRSEAMVLEVTIVIPFGQKSGRARKEAWGASGCWSLSFLILLGGFTGVSSLWLLMELYISDLHTFLYIYFKFLNSVNKTENRKRIVTSWKRDVA